MDFGGSRTDRRCWCWGLRGRDLRAQPILRARWECPAPLWVIEFWHQFEVLLDGVDNDCHYHWLLNPRRDSRSPASVSFDHLVGGGQQRFRDGKAEGLRRLEVNDELELGWPHDRKVGGFLALKDAAG